MTNSLKILLSGIFELIFRFFLLLRIGRVRLIIYKNKSF